MNWMACALWVGDLVSAGDGDAALRCALDHAERSIQADTPAMAALHSAVRLGAAAARRTARNWWRSPPSTRHPANPPATVVAHEVRFDPERQQWFADVDVGVDVDVDIPGGRTALLGPVLPNVAQAAR